VIHNNGYAEVSCGIENLQWDTVKHYANRGVVGANMTSLEDALNLCTGQDLKLILNVNHSLYNVQTSEVVSNVLELLHKYQLDKQIIISSTNPLLIYMIRQKRPDIATALRYTSLMNSLVPYVPAIPWLKESEFNDLQKCLLRNLDHLFTSFINPMMVNVLGSNVVMLHKDTVTPALVQEWQERSVRVVAFDVNLAMEKAYFSEVVGVQYVTNTHSTGKVIIEDWTADD